MATEKNIAPETGWRGLIQNWQSDLIASISVALVALPLCLGIAMAAGMPPTSGVLTAIIGGIVTTFYRGSHVGINGPGAGIIAVILSAFAVLDDGSGHTLNYVLAAIVVAGAIQTLLGLIKLGRFADALHSNVIRGILAAIGVIIFAKQIHIALGTQPTSNEIIQTLKEAILFIPDINPFVAIISLVGLVVLIFHGRIRVKLIALLPAPMWVLVLSIPFVYLFDFSQLHVIDFLGSGHVVGPHLLIDIPNEFLSVIAHPDFSRMGELPFWTSVLSITMIASIESLVSSKAVDRLDPYRRRTNLDKDLVGIGLSTMISGAIGGLPVTTVIVRSSVNINNHGKTKWTNFYHGIFLLMFMFFLSPVIQQVPLCALAILLVYTGFKLASPKIFKEVYNQGAEQLIFFGGTLLMTLYTNLLVGLFGGLLLVLTVQFLLARTTVMDFFGMILKPGTHLLFHKDGSYELKVKGIANFISMIRMDGLLMQIPEKSKVTIDLSETRLVDYSILEHLDEYRKSMLDKGGQVDIHGLEKHFSSSTNRLALRILPVTQQIETPRQISLREMALEHGWEFDGKEVDERRIFRSFYFFKSKLIKKVHNRIIQSGEDIHWQICDIEFQTGALIAAEEYKTTVGLMHIPGPLPRFTIEKKGFLDRYLIEHKDIDYRIYKNFSPEFSVKVEDKKTMDEFLTEPMRQLLIDSHIEHLESNGDDILIFSDNLRPALISEFARMFKFLEDMKSILRK
ncbi:MAG: SulP family inorganic anion transporter [Flavobacteriales bacterium]|nr:SulP family inorganic anion transporter [Flavobacteriales bacterium]